MQKDVNSDRRARSTFSRRQAPARMANALRLEACRPIASVETQNYFATRRRFLMGAEQLFRSNHAIAVNSRKSGSKSSDSGICHGRIETQLLRVIVAINESGVQSQLYTQVSRGILFVRNAALRVIEKPTLQPLY